MHSSFFAFFSPSWEQEAAPRCPDVEFMGEAVGASRPGPGDLAVETLKAVGAGALRVRFL